MERITAKPAKTSPLNHLRGKFRVIHEVSVQMFRYQIQKAAPKSYNLFDALAMRNQILLTNRWQPSVQAICVWGRRDGGPGDGEGDLDARPAY